MPVGSAWVTVSPDLTRFAAESDAGIKVALRGQKPDVRVGADTTAALADVTGLRKYIQSQDLSVQLSTAAASAKLTAMTLQADQLKARLSDITPNVKDAGALASIAAIDAALTAAKAKAGEIELGGVGGAGAVTAANALSRQFATLRNSAVNVATALEAASAETDNSGNVARKAAAGWFSLNGFIANLGEVSVPLFAGALGDMKSAIAGGDAELPGMAEHLINSASGFHLATEAVVEFIAIWGPAALAVTAFGLAAIPTVKAIGTQLGDMNVAATGTGDAFKSLATNGESVTAAVRPDVLEAFGIAEETLKNGSGELGGALSTLGGGFDQLLAKASVALGGGSGGIWKQGSADAMALAQSFTYVGDILGTLLKAVPGYAEVLLGFGNDALGMGAKIVGAVEPVAAVFLRLHGAILYAGIFGTAVSKMSSVIVASGANAAGALANLAGKYNILGGESGKLATGSADAADALDDMSAGPVIAGIGLLAGGIAAVALYLRASKSAAQSFNQTIQQTISSSTITSLQTALGSGISQTATQYNAALGTMVEAGQRLGVTYNTTAAGAEKTASYARGAGHALYEAAQNAGQYQAGLDQLDQQQGNFRANLTEVAGALGLQGSASSKSAQALSILEGAQVSATQATTKSASNTQVLNVQAAGYAATLSTLTAGTGALNSALNALGVTQSAQITDAQKIGQAYSSWIGIVTGGDSAFTTFEQGQNTLSSAMTGAGDSITEVAGKLTNKLTVANAALNGTSQASLAARQAFDSQITSATALYSNLQVLAAASDDTTTAQSALAQSGKDIVAQMLPMARGSAEATAELYSLAQIAGYSGPDAFKSLSTWVGNTSGAEASLNTQQTILTLSAANLTAAEKNLNSALNTAATTMQAQAIEKTVNLQGVTDALAASVENGGKKFSATSMTLAGQYYEALIKSGDGASTAKGDVDAFLTRLGATKGVVDTVNAALAKLPSKVSIAVDTTVSASGMVKAIESGSEAYGIKNALLGDLQFSGMAAGGPVRGGIHGRDSVPAMLAPGELVIPASHAAAFGDMARKASIPGFAAGGTVGSSLSDITSGLSNIVPTAGAAMGSFAASTAQAFVNSVKNAVPAGVAGVSGNVLSFEPDVLRAMQMLNIPMTDLGAIMAQMATESGGNLNAVNRTDSNAKAGHPSTGLFQLIAGTFAEYAGPYRNIGPFVNGVSINPMAQAYAALNYSAHRYGIANISSVLGHGHGYANGGLIPEPVAGVGLTSGRSYSFAENGPELVVPNGGAAAASNPGPPGATSWGQQTTNQVLQQILKAVQQQPQALARTIGGAAGSGYRAASFSAQG